MRGLLLIVLLALGGWWNNFHRVREANAALEDGTAAYRQKDYATAAQAFARARELGSTSDQLFLNLGHSYAWLGQRNQARQAYGRLLQSPSARLRSVAKQQLAVLAADAGNTAQAYSLLRQALLENPANAEARYNYELLTMHQQRRSSPQIPPPPPPTPKPNDEPAPATGQQQGQANRNEATPQAAPRPTAGSAAGGTQPAGGTEPGNGPEKPMAQGSAPGNSRGLDNTTAATGGAGPATSRETASAADARVNTRTERLRPLNLNEAQARQLLDALQAAERQYWQQIPHKATQRPDPRKPHW